MATCELLDATLSTIHHLYRHFFAAKQVKKPKYGSTEGETLNKNFAVKQSKKPRCRSTKGETLK